METITSFSFYYIVTPYIIKNTIESISDKIYLYFYEKNNKQYEDISRDLKEIKQLILLNTQDILQEEKQSTKIDPIPITTYTYINKEAVSL